MINYKEKLDANQYEAVTSSIGGNKICIASAGTGKTYTLTHRIAYLIDNGVNPENILLLTFTNKAAEEMISRTKSLLKDSDNIDDKDIEIFGGTFHSVAISLYYKYIHLVNQELANYSVINVDDCNDIISFLRDNYIEDLIDSKQAIVPSELKKEIPTAKRIYGMISSAFNNNISLKYLLRDEDFSDRAENAIISIAKKYTEYKKINKYYDFDDLLKIFYSLLKEPKLNKIIRNKYKYVFVDEVQDINKIQYEIIKLLENNSFLVGDAKQAIYGFRGSDSKYINNREEYFKGYEEFYLVYNYRSSQKVIETANKFISHVKPNIAEKENLICTKDIVGEFKHEYSFDANAQARDIANKIRELYRVNPDASFGVLLRTNNQSAVIETEFIRQGMNYELLCGLPFFSRKHVRDMVSFIRVVTNCTDIISFNRCSQLFPSIGPKSATKIYNIWNKYTFDADLIKINFSKDIGKSKYAESANKLTDFYVEACSIENVGDMLYKFYTDFYKQYLYKNYDKKEAEGRELDVLELIQVGKEKKSAKKLLSYINLMEQHRAADSEISANIKITTVHKAKGLEYDYVFIPSANDNFYPFILAKTAKELVEEENVFYVALTRARIALYIYTTKFVVSWDGNKQGSPSEYLEGLI